MNELLIMFGAIFAAISGSSILTMFVQIVIVALIVWVLLYGLAKIGIPEPFNKVLYVLIILFAVVIIVNFLLGLTGSGGFIKW